MRKHWYLNEIKYITRELDGEYIILNLDSGNYYTLEGAGNLIFRLINEDKPLADIERSVQKEYPDMHPRKMRRDILEFAKDLRRKGIIQEAS